MAISHISCVFIIALSVIVSYCGRQRRKPPHSTPPTETTEHQQPGVEVSDETRALELANEAMKNLLPVSKIPYKAIVGLAINPDNKERSVAVLSAEQGRQSMRDLTFSTFEEAWVFLPKHSLWIEVGTGERECISDSNLCVNTDDELLAALSERFDDIEVFHTHPSPVVSADRKLMVVSATMDKKIQELAKMALISGSDFRVAFSGMTSFYKKHPLGKMMYGVVSSLGISIAQIHPEFRQNLNRIDPLAITWRYRNRYTGFEAEISAGSSNIAEKINNFYTPEVEYDVRFSPFAKSPDAVAQEMHEKGIIRLLR